MEEEVSHHAIQCGGGVERHQHRRYSQPQRRRLGPRGAIEVHRQPVCQHDCAQIQCDLHGAHRQRRLPKERKYTGVYARAWLDA